MRRVLNVVSFTALSMLLTTSVFASGKKTFEQPSATAIIKKDLLGKPTVYKMPKGCITDDARAIARGKFIFHNLNGKKAKKKPPRGLAKKNANGKPKQYGNCVACHNIEGARGAGNIGPDLTGYKGIFVDSGVRSHQYVYQKIADPRVDNKNTHMTINLTTKLFSKREVCDITSYIVAPK